MMNCSKNLKRLQTNDPSTMPKMLKSTRIHKIDESGPITEQTDHQSVTTSLHLKNRACLSQTKSQIPNSILTSFPWSKRTFGVSECKFSSTTIVDGVTSADKQVHPSSIIKRVVVLPVETLVPDDVGYEDKYPAVLKVEETLTSEADLPDHCYIAIQKECTVEPKPQPPKVPKLSRQKLLLPAEKNESKRGLIRYGRSRMIADTHTSIPVTEFKAQLNYTGDITAKLDLAPPTKRMMHLLNTKGVHKLFALPGHSMGSKVSELFTRHLTSKQAPPDLDYDDMPLLPIGFKPEFDNSQIKRITRKRRYPEAEEYQRNLYKRQMENLYAMHKSNEVPDKSKVTIFLEQNEVVSGARDGVVLLGSADGSDAVLHEQVLENIIYQEDFQDHPGVNGEGVCLKKFPIENYPVILINDTEDSNEKIEGVLAQAEKIGISRDDIEKVIIFQQDELGEGTGTPFYTNNGNFIIVSGEPNESEVVIS